MKGEKEGYKRRGGLATTANSVGAWTASPGEGVMAFGTAEEADMGPFGAMGAGA